MGIHAAKSRRLPLAISILLTAGSSCFAQSAGRPIIFSSPNDNPDSTTSPSLADPAKSTFVESLSAPMSFNSKPTDVLPAPTTTTSVRPAMTESERLRNMLNKQKNWVFMTPAEILGVDDSQNTLNVPDRDAAGNRKTLTPAERYTERVNQFRSAYTNSLDSDNQSTKWDFSNLGNDQPDAMTPSQGLNPNRITAPNNSGWMDSRNNNSAWARLTATPALVSPDRDDEQKSAMAQFQDLLESRSASPVPKVIPVSAPDTTKSPWDSIASQPVANPVGASFTPLSTGIGIPTGLPALPSLTAPAAVKIGQTPIGAPQPAPWLSTAPQPGVIPQRKF